MTTTATEWRHILIPERILTPYATEVMPMCGGQKGIHDVPSILCRICIEALGLGAPFTRLFPVPATVDWHVKVKSNPHGALWCGAEGFTSTRSVTDDIPFCPECLRLWKKEVHNAPPTQ